MLHNEATWGGLRGLSKGSGHDQLFLGENRKEKGGERWNVI